MVAVEDLLNLGEDPDLSADVCIVGSGPAAWTLARELSASNIRVLILESGSGRPEADATELNDVEDVGMPLFNGRCRAFGGTTTAPGWGNRCIALDPIDYEARAWVAHSGWPFGPEEILPYLNRASEYLGAGPYLADPMAAPSAPRCFTKPDVDPHQLRHIYWVFGRDRNWSPTKFDSMFRQHGGDNIRVVLRATVTHLNVDPQTGRIASVEIGYPSGARKTVSATTVVLCTGGIENPRLLLNSNRQVPHGLGNAHDVVGRFLMDHPRDLNMSITFDPRHLWSISTLFGPIRFDSGAGHRLFVGGLSLSEELQRREGLLNCAAWPMEEWSADDPIGAAIRLAKRDRTQTWADLRRMAARPGFLTRAVHSRLMLDQPVRRLQSKFGLFIASEQSPDPQSRVSLSERRDRFGLPLAKTDWRISRQDRASQGRLARLIAAEFERLSLPKATLAGWVQDEAYDDTVLQDGCHPTGATRMATDPRMGVVDINCQVHGVGGLYVAGSSVFPTAGHANPTLMIVAMALRLSEHLRLQLGQVERPLASKAAVSEEGVGWAPAVSAGTRVAVTGSNGFIGGRLVERLVEQGAVVTCLNRGPAGARVQRTGAAVQTLDLADAPRTLESLRGVQLVFHCAYDWEDEDWNLKALHAMIAAGRANKCSRFVHVSSFVVYETPARGEVSETTEETTAQCGYAFVKRQMELELLKAHGEDGFPCAILQPTIVYGPYSKPWTSEPGEMLRYGTVILPDKGEGLCAAVYVDDVVDAMLIAATNPAAIGERFLVSGPEPVTWAAFYEGLAMAAGVKGPKYLPFETIEQENTRLAKLRRFALDPERVTRRVAQVGPVRKALQAGLKVLPSPLKSRLHDQLYGPNSRRRGYVHMPGLAHARWISSQYTVMSGKARRRLGYRPRVALSTGMNATAPYLRRMGEAEQ